MDGANGELSNDIMMCESQQIYIRACKDVTAKALDTVTHLLQSAAKLLSPSSTSFKYFDFALNRQGIDRISLSLRIILVSKSRMTVLSYKSLMVAIPTEALNEKANVAHVIANNKDFIVGMESLVSFYSDQKMAVTKSDKPAV
ncbi:MAG: hypothetical protein P4M11_10620 [Candidatus Pacebacteria bacterium]|nr:hypothetical protein [Candidatus Paceibacterota bacterium]